MMPCMKRKNRLYLIRHGQVVGFERVPIIGHTDVDITEVGRIQMEALAERLRLVHLDAVYSSDLIRSRIGARIIVRHHDVEVKILKDMKEMYFGDWETLSLEAVRERYPEELARREKALLDFEIPGGGESLKAFSKRVLKGLRGLLKKSEGQDIAIVAHGGVNRVILCDALGLDLSRMFSIHQSYGCLNIIDYFPDARVVRLVNG
jgi:alpha-ribazole phosphatase/probable phosphoglycerate mutase